MAEELKSTKPKSHKKSQISRPITKGQRFTLRVLSKGVVVCGTEKSMPTHVVNLLLPVQ